MPRIISIGGSPIVESSQIQIFFPLPGIQVRVGVKKLCTFESTEKIENREWF
jgi:hypothetical protein